MALKSASTYLEKKLLNHSFGVEAFTMPTAVYLALYKSNPGPLNTGTEVSANGAPALGYERKAMTMRAAAETSAGTGPSVITNELAVSFGPCSGSAWETITHVAVFDAAENGNMLFYGALSEPKTIGLTDTLTIPVDQYSMSLD
jgi:hypothetical protein